MADQNEFLKPLLDMMNGRMDRIESKIDTNTTLTQQALDEVRDANGRLDGHSGKIKNLQNEMSKLQTRGFKKIDLSPNVMYLIAVGAVILLAIVATLLHISLGGLFR